MSVLSVDLAYKSYRDCGLVILREGRDGVGVEFPQLPLSDPPHPEALATALVEIANAAEVFCILVDGPQAWKDPSNGLLHSRRSERALNTPAKTGLPGQVKPANYLPFVAFSIALFDALEELGWPRLRDPRNARRSAVESFPTAAWRALGLVPLPAKRKSHAADLEGASQALRGVFPFHLSRRPNHDELQALVAAWAGLALEKGWTEGFSAHGQPPRSIEGIPREGFILLPRAAPNTIPADGERP